jgi:adenylate kinase
VGFLTFSPLYSELPTNPTPGRDYPENKLQENLDSEIMEVLLQEARDSYDEEIIVELTSNTSDEVESNVERIEAWLKQWKEDNTGAQ